MNDYARLLALFLALGLAACGKGGANSSAAGIIQTKMPGEITAGGGTSGENLHLPAPKTSSAYQGGTPGIAGGAGGTAGGPATAGTRQESGQGPGSPGGANTPTPPGTGSGAH
jgi:hypothetical protein